ncbi:hypothetical protein MMC13_004441 [Lambiella insularis]|nr:hypothetical protein [Lambiella insularis]
MLAKAQISRPLWSSYFSATSRPYICASCIQKRAIRGATRRIGPLWEFDGRLRQKLRRQHASSVTPVKAVNVTKIIPPSNKELYHELTVLEKEVPTFVNLSQLRLILRGLESENPIIRVAVLGVNGSRGPRNLVKALLADPLGPKQPWENDLENSEDTRALLIRYGEEYEYDQRHPLQDTLSIPSTTLKSHDVEIVIHSLCDGHNENNMTVDLASSDLLVPTLGTPISAYGRVSTITYPVHKTLVFGENVSGIPALPRIIVSRSIEGAKEVLHSVVNVQWQSLDSETSSDQPITLVNLPQAEKAIASFRVSLNNFFDYERDWIASNLPLISAFILSGTSPTRGTVLNPAVRSLINFVLEETTSAISLARSRRLALAASSTVSELTRTTLSKSLTRWAEAAHTELQGQLSLAFSSRSWRKLAWWKLLWRVDDVGFISADILQRSFLIEAEKEIIWIGGRVQQAFLSPTAVDANPNITQTKHRLGAEPPPLRLRDVLPSPSSEEDLSLRLGSVKPWPREIGLVRARLLLGVPALQALAQKLFLQSLSTTALTSTLSALLYVSVSTTSIYEAGAIGVVGFVWSSWRLQRMWESAREAWEGMVREEGRKVLGVAEGSCREAIQSGGRGSTDVAAELEEKRAFEAVERVTTVLANY